MPDPERPRPTPEPLSDKSTNVRSPLWRLGMRLASAVAPAGVEQWAFERFCTPVRPRPARPPQVPGMHSHGFAVESRGRTLRAWDWGEGPTVLLVHGWSGHAGQMIAFVPALVAAGYHVVAFDHPAHGTSGGSRTTLLELRDAVLAVGRRFALGEPLAGIVAHSLGSPATLLALDRGLPAQRVVLLAPPTDPLPWVDAAGLRMGLPAARVEALKARITGYLRSDLGDRDAHTVAAQLSAPLLVMHDEDDRAVPFAAGKALAEACPHAELVALRGLGHRRMLADPALIERAVGFLRGPAAVRLAAE
jgi:pimeloyl-ACP methyl ester carboxylesterase